MKIRVALDTMNGDAEFHGTTVEQLRYWGDLLNLVAENLESAPDKVLNVEGADGPFTTAYGDIDRIDLTVEL